MEAWPPFSLLKKKSKENYVKMILLRITRRSEDDSFNINNSIFFFFFVILHVELALGRRFSRPSAESFVARSGRTIPGIRKCVGGLYSSSKGEGITRRKAEKKEQILSRASCNRVQGALRLWKLRGRRSEKERERELHLFSPPCSKQKRDDLCGAGAAAPRRGRILAFSSAPSRVARVAECAVAFSSSFVGLSTARGSRCIFLRWHATTGRRSFFFFSSSPVLCRTFPREAG